jgi:NAD(P)-dependent dehydrogenase (short-subunit alcohol dehydrogenase family)
MQAVEQQYGRLDYALNNAGIAGERAVLHKYPTDTFDDVMAVNVRGVWLCMKHQLPLMLKHPELDPAIVVTSSTAGEGPSDGACTA